VIVENVSIGIESIFDYRTMTIIRAWIVAIGPLLSIFAIRALFRLCDDAKKGSARAEIRFRDPNPKTFVTQHILSSYFVAPGLATGRGVYGRLARSGRLT
jgi:hypothetical protein